MKAWLTRTSKRLRSRRVYLHLPSPNGDKPRKFKRAGYYSSIQELMLYDEDLIKLSINPNTVTWTGKPVEVELTVTLI